MNCQKCGYSDKNRKEKFGVILCRICFLFSPEKESDFQSYVSEKLDWKVLETFRKYGQSIGIRQKKGMNEQAKKGRVVTRVALGYSLMDRTLTPNEQASKVRLLFNTFLNTEISLNALSKQQGLSVNGLKKILKNRTYLGEVKFDNQLFKGNHEPIINPEIFYAVQRKLNSKSSKKTIVSQ